MQQGQPPSTTDGSANAASAARPAAASGAAVAEAAGAKPMHHYALANTKRPKEYYDYENATISFASIDPYECSRKIGRGKYSEVFVGRNRANGAVCVIKTLKPVKHKKVLREITILQNLFGGPNVVKLLDVAVDPRTNTTVLVFEHVNNADFRQLYPTLSDHDVRFYMFELFRTLEFSHSMGVMHRDVKPQNIMIDHEQRKLRLIDWGLGEYFHHGQDYNVRVASRHYKGPELLVNFRYYDYSLDVWSLGCVFAAILFQREPFFCGSDNTDQLVQILKVCGTEALVQWCAPASIVIPSCFNGLLQNWPRRPWLSLVGKGVRTDTLHPAAIDLLDRMLVIDPSKRIHPRDALMHAYFDPVRY